ncbi:MAG TPA: hypothetical protein PL172_11375 [Thermomicrobiales bacterium]|nr:hypothetical protein [Thermomicrobiales bacterium]
MRSIDDIVGRVVAGEPVDPAMVAQDDWTALIDGLIGDPRGRRWLRSWPALNPVLAARLLDWPEDFVGRRRDTSLDRVVELASLDDLDARAEFLAVGPAASAMWRRFASDPDRLIRVAKRVVMGEAGETTLSILVLDPIDEHCLGDERRISVAEAALAGRSPAARGAAVEFLSDVAPAVIVDNLDTLVADEDERVRGVAWLTGLRAATTGTFDRAIVLLADETVPIQLRRSALLAIGTSMPTSAIAEVLSVFVVHPDERLAHDAADLLYARHRNPITAEAALLSPHPDVREVAMALLDPLRGSPAAGGSRPGDPTRTLDIFKALLERGDGSGVNETPRC